MSTNKRSAATEWSVQDISKRSDRVWTKDDPWSWTATFGLLDKPKDSEDDELDRINGAPGPKIGEERGTSQ